MIQYLALLRGINVGGKNKISMVELQDKMENNGFKDVLTYINSGNIIFKCEEEDKAIIANKIETFIKSNFGLNIPVLILNKSDLQTINKQIPSFWDITNKDFYYNLVFYIPPFNKNEFLKYFPQSNEEVESVYVTDNCVYWSFILNKHHKTTLSKIASSPINTKVTLRTVNTIKKLLGFFT